VTSDYTFYLTLTHCPKADYGHLWAGKSSLVYHCVSFSYDDDKFSGLRMRDEYSAPKAVF